MTLSEILTADCRGFKIYGLFRKLGYLYCFGMTPMSVGLVNHASPAPVMLKLSAGLSSTQVIYMGYRIHQGVLEFLFFDDGGMSGLCVVSGDYFVQYKDEMSLEFRVCDHRRVEVLMRRLKDSGGFVL